jgi:hypothetical protein
MAGDADLGTPAFHYGKRAAENRSGLTLNLQMDSYFRKALFGSPCHSQHRDPPVILFDFGGS